MSQSNEVVSSNPCAALRPSAWTSVIRTKQSRHLLATGENTGLADELDCVDVVGRTAGEPDDLPLGKLRLKNE